MRKLFLSTLATAALLSCGTTKELTTSTQGIDNNVNYSEFFTDGTMRFDFHHAGDSKEEFYYFDKVIREGEWAGSKVSLINPFDYGEQHFRIIDKATGKVIYKNNYCTLFNEWQTTPEATVTSRSFPEGVIFPEPSKDFIIEFYARNKQTKEWEKRYAQDVRVNDYNIAIQKPQHECIDIHVGGDIAHSLDIVLLPDGFTAEEKEKFLASCHTCRVGTLKGEGHQQAGNRQVGRQPAGNTFLHP